MTTVQIPKAVFPKAISLKTPNSQFSENFLPKNPQKYVSYVEYVEFVCSYRTVFSGGNSSKFSVFGDNNYFTRIKKITANIVIWC